MKEDKREILTSEIIKAQIKKIFFLKIKLYSISSIFWGILCFIIIRFNINSLADYKPTIFTVLFFFIIAFSSVIFIESIIKLTISIYNLIAFPKKTIITTDTLCNIKNKRIYRFLQIDFRYCLSFSKNGDFVLEEKLESSSLNIDDTFYLAMVNEKIIKIYNNKFFILEE